MDHLRSGVVRPGSAPAKNRRHGDHMIHALVTEYIAVAQIPVDRDPLIGIHACHANNCPVGIATQKPHLRARLPVDIAAERLARFFSAAVELMTVLARAAGQSHLNEFSADDLTTFKTDMADLTGVAYGGVGRA